MNRYWIPSEHLTEVLATVLRWLLLGVCTFVFFYPPVAHALGYDEQPFMLLFLGTVAFTAFSQYTLIRSKAGSMMYRIVTKTAVALDGIAVMWLVFVTGGLDSPFFMAFFLVTLHVSLYWRITGAMASAFLIVIVYTALLAWTDSSVFKETVTLYRYSIQNLLLISGTWFLGVVGWRERVHHRESMMYRAQANLDELTGLYNHRYFQETVGKAVESGTPAFLVMADIDSFKDFNDQYGHLTGDDILRKVGQTFSSLVPEEKGLAYRYGGEEFAILYFGSNRDHIRRLVRDIQEALHHSDVDAVGRSISVTLSFGVATVSRYATKNEAIDQADKLMYLAKTQGKDRAMFDFGDSGDTPAPGSGFPTPSAGAMLFNE